MRTTTGAGHEVKKLKFLIGAKKKLDVHVKTLLHRQTKREWRKSGSVDVVKSGYEMETGEIKKDMKRERGGSALQRASQAKAENDVITKKHCHLYGLISKLKERRGKIEVRVAQEKHEWDRKAN